MSDSDTDTFRWHKFFQHSTQPIFLLNPRRRLLFVNRAWEACTGLSLTEVRGRVCRRRPTLAESGHEDNLLGTCAPPGDAIRGQICQVRRRAPDKVGWWELQFFPMARDEGVLGILGTIRVIAAPTEAPFSLPERLMALRDHQATRYRLQELGSGSPIMERLQEQARLASQSSAPVAIHGERGTGREWLARAIHCASGRTQRYFLALDAERLPGDMLGDVLFGARSRQLGAGTVFLRDASFLPREWQGRLADAIRVQDNPDFPRLIIGLRTDPKEETRSGRLLPEFYFAASTIALHVPPLRERRSELVRFIEIFLERQRSLISHGVTGVSAEALLTLRSYAWPNNLLELQEVVRGACRRAKTDRIEQADLPFHLKHNALPAERHLPLDAILEQVERRLILLAMKLTQNNQTRAAELLEIWRPRLLRRLEKFGEPIPEPPASTSET